MKAVVITGSTRGIGYGLADSFLALGCAVAIGGRTEASVMRAVEKLAAKHGADRVETVAPWLAQRVLANEKHGARISWLTGGKVLARFLLAPFRTRDLFA